MVKKIINVNGKKIPFTIADNFDPEGSVLKHKLVPLKELEVLGNFYRSRNQTIAFTTGVFDLIHGGHARYLNLASKLGDVLIVGLNSDSSVRSLKGKNRPIEDEIHRAEMLGYLQSVNYITIFPELTGANAISLLRPDTYLCVEGSFQGDISTKEEVVAVAKYGGKVVCAPRQGPTVSTTAIIEKVAAQQTRLIIEHLQKNFANTNEGDIF